MTDDRHHEIDHNYDFFQRNLNEYLVKHRGEFALLRKQTLVGFYADPGGAYRAGLAKFADELFSIQEVEDRPAEMGMMSVALD
jgi:hypothetical protein